MTTNLVKTRRLILCWLAVLAFVSVGVLPSAVAQNIFVESADPAMAEQGTLNLDVAITGSGFASGAKAKFLVTGTTNPGGVTVNRTTFVSSQRVIANVDVAVDAEVGDFDIEVTVRGRTGKGIDLFAVYEYTGNPADGFLAAASFADLPGDRIRSDGVVLPAGCGLFGFDYVDVADPCYEGTQPLQTVSAVGSGHGYFLRTVRNHEPLTVDRWLVLDFSEPEVGYQCPGLDTRLIAEIQQAIANDPDSDPLVWPPENPDPCIDELEVRFSVDGAFLPGVLTTGVGMVVDVPVRKLGHGHDPQAYTQWDARFILDFVNPLSLTYVSAGEVIVGAVGDDFRVALWTFDERTGKRDEFMGFYTMPFQLTLQKRE